MTRWSRDEALDCAALCEAVSRQDEEAFGFLLQTAAPPECMAERMARLVDALVLHVGKPALCAPDGAQDPELDGGDPRSWCVLLAQAAGLLCGRYGLDLREFCESLPSDRD